MPDIERWRGIPWWFRAGIKANEKLYWVPYLLPLVVLAVAFRFRMLWFRRGNVQLARMLTMANDDLPTLVNPERAVVEDGEEDIPSEVAVERTFEQVTPDLDTPAVQRARLGPCSKKMLALIRLRFGVPAYTLANEEMIRRFIFQNADVYRGVRTTHLPKWIASVIALSFVPSEHEIDLRRILTGNLTLYERMYNFGARILSGVDPVHTRVASYAAMLER